MKTLSQRQLWSWWQGGTFLSGTRTWPQCPWAKQPLPPAPPRGNQSSRWETSLSKMQANDALPPSCSFENSQGRRIFFPLPFLFKKIQNPGQISYLCCPREGGAESLDVWSCQLTAGPGKSIPLSEVIPSAETFNQTLVGRHYQQSFMDSGDEGLFSQTALKCDNGSCSLRCRHAGFNCGSGFQFCLPTGKETAGLWMEHSLSITAFWPQEHALNAYVGILITSLMTCVS